MNQTDGDLIVRTLDLYFRGVIDYERARTALEYAPRWLKIALAGFDDDRSNPSRRNDK